ncbi:uncharacterized protein LOC143299422 [Babylonia areolata]|uniref:uncharacterized protein LOC143299422 n=1 Tax=Babylonia areolata TaxID=304850 RepID=UPI003FD53F3D
MERTGIGVVWLCLGCVLVSVQADNVNVAPGKTYDQSSKYNSSSDDSSQAANGDTDRDYPDNGIHTSRSDPNNPWWEVNLGRVYPVHDITVWARPGFEERLYPSTITVDGQQCASIQSIPSNTRRVDVTCPAVIYGQTVRITRHTHSWQYGAARTLNMAEMEIWVPSEVSECPVGTYGSSCNSQCSQQCGKGPGKNFCYKDTGYCYDGCVAGRYGDQCTTPCSPGCQNTVCDRQTGQCSQCNTGYTELQCSECQDKYYKTTSNTCVQCNVYCRSQSCDKATGRCDVNVAPGKTYDQSSKYNSSSDDSSQAANGDTDRDYPDNGIHTSRSDPNNPWWEVNLGRVYPVHDITVWARPGFEERLYPSTITVDGQQCASIQSIPSNTRRVDVTCPAVMYGQRVRITRQSAGLHGNARTLNMAEMQIWVPSEVSECAVGTYGSSCNSQCSQQCGKGPGKNFCYKDTGYCYDGCVAGRYGDQCTTPCSPGCQNTGCDRQTGQCSPCNTGYTGSQCSECQDKYYKTTSNTCVQCNVYCRSQSCDKATGRCDDCVDGRYGDMCDKTCSTANCRQCDRDTGTGCTECTLNSNLELPDCTECQDKYYKTTSNTCIPCSVNCVSQNCDKETGRCDDCVDGRYGDMCDKNCSTANCRRCDRDTGTVCTECTLNSNLEPPDCTECQDGYYKTTSNTCIPCSINCVSQYCDKETGRCDDCVDGRYGDMCDKNCSTANCRQCDRDTGTGCTECTLNSNLEPPDCTECLDDSYKPQGNTFCSTCTWTCHPETVCDKTSGHCPLCPPGRRGDRCDQDCEAGRYGQNCTEHCGHCVNPQTTGYCDVTNGHCQSGCEDGWQPPLCNEECEDGYYGLGCNQKCGNCRVSSECLHDTGRCTGQCAEGFTGLYCTEEKNTDAVIIGSAVGGGIAFLGICIVILGVIIWVLRSRRMSQQNKQATDGTEGSTCRSSRQRAAAPADRGKATPAPAPAPPPAAFHELQGEEEHYERVGDMATVCADVLPDDSAVPETTESQGDTGSANPYDKLTVLYHNTGEVQLYDRWLTSTGHGGKTPDGK